MLVMRVPEKAIVKRKHRNLTITRRGRGYSIKELKDAGLVNNNIHIAINKGIPVDILRDTAHIENVGKSAKFSYDYENHTIIVRLDRVKTIEFNIYDFAEWDRQKYFNNVCYDTG